MPCPDQEAVETEVVTDVSGSDTTTIAWEHVYTTSPPELRRWLDNSKPVAMHQDALMVAVPNNFTRNQLEGRFRPDIEQQLSDYFQRSVQLAVIVDATVSPEPPAADQSTPSGRFDVSGHGRPNAAPVGPGLDPRRYARTADPSASSPGSASNGWDLREPADHRPDPSQHRTDTSDPAAGGRPGSGPLGQPDPGPAAAPFQSPYGQPTSGHAQRPVADPDVVVRPRKEIDARLNPKYTFETFVIGSSNRFAHAAAVAVAENPGKSYNPLTIYGESGLGKTHLLHAIGRYARDYFERVRVRYVSTEELTNDFINAISQNKGAEFRRRYRDVDVLLIDDIQFLEGKEQTQEEFFHTFNTLHNAQKQIVMTSDRPPKNLENLEPRLRSRFGWGLITDIQPPDLETRIAILRKKAAQERLVAGPDVLEFIASRIQTNIRELEGALIRVTAFASLNRQQVDLALAEVVL